MLKRAGTTSSFTVNGETVALDLPPITRLADALRDGLGLTGTKIGCNAGDCGACTVLIDGKQACSCLVPVGQAVGCNIVTVEGLAENGQLSALQRAFHQHGAAQCGICTPGMLMAASELLAATPKPTRSQVEDAMGGVLCRCTGYVKIVDAVVAFAEARADESGNGWVGARLKRVDGVEKLNGDEKFGADHAPDGSLWLRIVRSPHARARFEIGDTEAFRRKHKLALVLTAEDVPMNSFGIYPSGKDQPVLAVSEVQYRGDAVIGLVGSREIVEAIAEADIPIHWEPIAPVTFVDAQTESALALHKHAPNNVLVRGRVVKGDVDKAFANAAVTAEVSTESGFVEHAYIEPEAGYAQRIGDRLEIVACTQCPTMDRDEIAHIMRMEKSAVRVIPTATGGGFGGKLDLSVQPLVALAAWMLQKPVRCIYSRPESMMATTKRHPSQTRARAAADKNGRLLAVDFAIDFDTGAYASWGPTVANRVPVHATGPYHVPHVRATSRALHTNNPPAGAFRGFGVPQAAIAHEGLMDQLADKLGMDRLEFRLLNAIRAGEATATGQVLTSSAGLAACLEALRDDWREALAKRVTEGPLRRGVGIACMWYGIGNTSLPNPSTMRVGLKPDGRLMLYNGAADIGQGSNTIMIQIAAEALGVSVENFDYVMGDTDLTEDAGKTSASRQTYVSGRAAELAARALRAEILKRSNAGEDSTISLSNGRVTLRDSAGEHVLELTTLKPDAHGDVLSGQGSFDPPTSPLDDAGQGIPYACYGFAAQMAEVTVDVALGLVKVVRMVAAHDVGRAINPTLVEGQIHGGIAQGLGLALMEEYLPGRTENLHDYLIPTFGDMPEIKTILIEDAAPFGPFGAKGIGEPALIPTAPAIFAGIENATGVRITRAPATPDRVHAALKRAGVRP
ncbi:MAG: molybdopterin-dependent oxidoreductase [Rhizobiales bacterium]|nr:molybdopterin-dependent oxidoreductase [Hyphomicrobiales bacterium]